MKRILLSQSHYLKTLRVMWLFLCLFSPNICFSATKYLYVGETDRIETPSPVSSNGYIDNAVLLSTADALSVDTSDPFDVKITVLRYFSNVVTVKVRFVEKYTNDGHIGKVDHDVEVSIGAKYPTVKSVNADMTIKVGETKKLEYQVTPDGLLPPDIVWGTSNFYGYTDNYISYSNDGHDCWVTGKKKGKCDIIGLPFNQQSKAMAYVITVVDDDTQVEPTDIVVSPYLKTIEVGETFTPTYSLTPSNASTTVTWSSDDSSIASVNKTTGLVTGKKTGTTYINATTANGKTDWCKVAVTSSTPDPIVPTSISVSPSSKTIEVGEGFSCSYTISPSNANSQTSVTWTSDDNNIATVSSSGYVTGKKAGSTYINATTANGKEDWCKVTVTEAVNPTEPESSEPNIKQISLGYAHSLILKTDGTLWACGWNKYGQLGDGTTTDRKTPVKVMSDVAQVSAGYYHTMILKTDGSLWACGSNDYGQLGDGTTTDRKSPVKVMTDVSQVFAGGKHTMIMKTDGSLWACGNNDDGQLGDGTTTDRKTPVKVMTDVAQVSAGYYHTMILKTDGTLWSCGYNNNGQLGDGTTTYRTTPVKVMTDVAQVSAGGYHTMILKTDITLWACGDNLYGQLGDGTTTDRKTPQQVMSDVAQVSAGRLHTMILKIDGTLWACGDNGSGQLGDGTTTSRTTPVKVMSDVAQVSSRGDDHTMIQKTDGTLWACGDNNSGQLGDGTTTDRTSFVKIAESNITGNEITVSTSNAGYATFYSAGFAYTLPYGLSAQVVTNASNGKLTYKTIADGSASGVIPAGTAVMLVTDFRKPTTYTMKSTASSAPYLGTNLLRGSDEATTTTGNGYHYKLSYGQSGSNLSNVFGWYWGAQNGAPFQVEGHKAWLVVSKSSLSTRGFAIGGEATGIEMISGDDDVEADAVYYDLQGRRVTNPTVKGVYIKNGKKVMVK